MNSLSEMTLHHWYIETPLSKNFLYSNYLLSVTFSNFKTQDCCLFKRLKLLVYFIFLLSVLWLQLWTPKDHYRLILTLSVLLAFCWFPSFFYSSISSRFCQFGQKFDLSPRPKYHCNLDVIIIATLLSF